MGKFGKWLGGGLGFVLGGPIGGLLGFLIGSAADEADQFGPYMGQQPATTAQGDFGMSLLVLISAVMKADGKVVKAELDYVKQFFLRQFGEYSARQALIVLRDMLRKDIPVYDVCRQVKMNMDYASRLQLLHLLFNLSAVDANIQKSESDLIKLIADNLGISSTDFTSIRNMFVPETDSAYKILEVEPTATNDQIKKAYRKMALKYHPDKVAHLGEQYRKAAEEKFSKVNEAYERVSRERNIV